jgi:hypothetical protein
MATYSSFTGLDTPIGDAGDSGFARLNQRLRPDQLQPGEVAISENGRMGVDGAWQTRRGINLISPPLTTSGQVLTLPFYAYANVTPSALSNAGGVISMTVTGHDFVNETLASVTGITGLTPSFEAGNYEIAVGDANTISIDTNGATGTPGGTVTVGAPIIDGSAVNAIFASCVFSNPNTEGTEFIVIATNQKAFAIPTAGGAAIQINYPADLVLINFAEMIQAFDRVYLFRDGLTSFVWDGDITGTPAFTLVANGNYTQPVVLGSSNNTSASNGVVEVSETDHGLSVGDTIVIVDGGSGSPPELTKGDSYTVATVADADTFTFFAQVENFGSKTVTLSKRVSSSLGFMHMPAPPFAVYHQRRLWMPFRYLSSGSSGTPTITNRNILDEIVASDIFDSDTYDRLNNQFRIASGGADKVVGIQPFADDNLLIFCRNSIHLIARAGGDLGDTVVKEITREIGCVARKSIIQVGNQVFFLSDNGVYSVDFGDLYNLRGATLPLSESIQPIINRINPNFADRAVATYHDNRYYIAVPLDGVSENNALLVYNFINSGWESVDTVNDPAWNIRNLLRSSAGGLNKLFVVNSVGGVNQVDGRLDAVDLIAVQTNSNGVTRPIVSRVATRAYTMGTIDKKRFGSFEVQMESSDTNASNANFTLITENPDGTTVLKNAGVLLDGTLGVSESASLEGRCGNKRGYSGQLVIAPTQGRPKIRAVKLTAQLTELGISTKT